MRIQWKKALLLMGLLWLAVIASACTKDKLQEGSCVLNVSLSGVPDSIHELPEGLADDLRIYINLYNPQNGISYSIPLSYNNQYQYTAKLHPGRYEVKVGEGASYAGTFEAVPVIDRTEITLEAGNNTPVQINVSLEDPAALAASIERLMATEEIIAADKFSRKVQVNGQVINMQDLLKHVDVATLFTDIAVFAANGSRTAGSAESTVESGGKATLSGSGITVRLYNEKNTEASLAECKVIEIETSRTFLIFPGGVMRGTSAEAVAGKESGCYGTPTRCTGSVLVGLGMGDTTYHYLDPDSGDLILVQMNGHMEVGTVTYKLEQYTD